MRTETKFYQIKDPTTKQIFDAIIGNEYVPFENMKSKAKQIEILLLDYWNADEILVTYTGVTNTGGVPIFLSSSACLYEVASEQFDDWHDLSEEDQQHEIELLGWYLQTYKTVFNL